MPQPTLAEITYQRISLNRALNARLRPGVDYGLVEHAGLLHVLCSADKEAIVRELFGNHKVDVSSWHVFG